MIFLWNNLFDDYSTITANTTATGYPVTNLQDYQLEKKWRSVGSSSGWVKLQCGSTTIMVNYIAIAEHNFSTGATIKIQAGASDSWASPTLDASLTYSTGIIMEAVTCASSFKWWRIYIDDTSNSDGYVEMGRPFLGTKLELAFDQVLEFILTKVDTSTKQYSISGQGYGDEGIVYNLFQNVTFPVLSSTAKDDMDEMFAEVKKVKPVFMLLHTGRSTELRPTYCSFVTDPSYTHIENLDYSLDKLSFREDK